MKSMLRSQPMSSNQDTTSDKLTIPSEPPDFSRRDFEDVKFWTRGDWQRHQKSCEERGKDLYVTIPLTFDLFAEKMAPFDTANSWILKNMSYCWNPSWIQTSRNTHVLIKNGIIRQLTHFFSFCQLHAAVVVSFLHPNVRSSFYASYPSFLPSWSSHMVGYHHPLAGSKRTSIH